MEHVVFFPAHDGSPAFRRVPSLDEAVRLVEHLRNVEGVNEVSCHALAEVPLAFRAYYRVEVPAVGYPPVDVPVQQETLADLAAAPVAELLPDPEQEPAMAGLNGRSTETANSLGFFA